MKVEGQDAPSGQEKTRPERDAFQQVLQRASERGTTSGRPRTDAQRGPTQQGGPPGPGALRPGGTGPGQTTRVSSPLPGVRAASAVLSTTRGALGSPAALRQARQGMHVEAQRLGTVRQEAHATGQEQASHRASELLTRELERSVRAELRAAPLPAPPPREARSSESPPTLSATGGHGVTGGGAAAAGMAATPVAQVESTLALIEKIEVFVRSQRPALGLSLRGSLEATVEVERTGPREVALRIQGRHGPVPPADVARLRDALEARGLRLSALQAG
ncbi:hypothetical protein FOF48_12945 [Corallococcus sp. Z5C101001]|nr:hypothetical protein FOF48_12945 [Corallococcus sp. Z5C101001]